MMNEWRARCAVVFSLSLLAAACADPPRAEGSNESGLTGVVLETMDGGGYTYARVELEDADLWVAGPLTPLEVGDTVELIDTMAMGPFNSPALDRTFEEMIFVMGFQSAESAAGVPPGVAKQVFDAGGYTYLEIESEGGEFWLAAPDTDIPAGAEVVWKGPMLMRDFHSASLDRTFKEIFFVDNVWVSR